MRRRNIFCSLVCLFSLFVLFPAYNFAGGAKENRRAGEIQNKTPKKTPAFPQKMLVFTGVSGRLSSKKDSINAALLDAARRLSFFNGVRASVINREHIGLGVFDIRIEADYQFDYDKELAPFLEQLEFDPDRDVFEADNAVFVTTRLVSEISMPSAGGYSSGTKRPWWVDSPPAEINGFIAGTGFAGRRSSHKDTVVASYEKAVIEIIENMGATIAGRFSSRKNSYSVFGTETITDTTSISEGALRRFYVIETWTDPKTLEVWTLAVAEKTKK